MTKTTFFSVILLISFFLPWFDFVFFQISAYGIPLSIDKFINLSQTLSSGNFNNIYKFTYILYIIPLIASYNIYKDVFIKEKKKTSVRLEFILAAMLCGISFALILNSSLEFIKVLSIGFYSTSIFAIFGFIPVKDEENLIKTNRDLIGAENSRKKESLDRLEQLHMLKQNEVINEEIYARERLQLLANLNPEIQEQNKHEFPSGVNSTHEEPHLITHKNWKLKNARWIGFSIPILIIICFFLYKSTIKNKLNITGQWAMAVHNITFKGNGLEKEQFEKMQNTIKSFLYTFDKDSSVIVQVETIEEPTKFKIQSGTYHILNDGKILVMEIGGPIDTTVIKKINNDSIILISNEKLEIPFNKVP